MPDLEPESLVSVDDKYGPAMDITDQAEADSYFEKCVQHNMSFGTSRTRAEEVEKTNLGYFAGYYDAETRERVERLFRCSHPIFGSIAENGPPTTDQALMSGVLAARK
jgi:hypothetical protein